MVNNIGKTNKTLSTNLGEKTSFTNKEDVTLITGEIGLGLLIFDSAGTLGAISEFTDESNFIVTTYALSINISTILNLNY